MLGSAATQIQKSRAKLAEYIKANKEDIVLIENCTAATASVIRAVGLRAGDTAIHLSTAYGMVKNCILYCAAATGANVVEVKVVYLHNFYLHQVVPQQHLLEVMQIVIPYLIQSVQ